MTDRVGQRFGDYRLTRFIGRGGFGDVYQGQHVTDSTLAAIKLMETRLDANDLKLFIQETSTIFRMKHPHIVQMLDFGISNDGIPFLAMAYAPNGTLRQLHPRGARLPLATVVSYVTPIADALQFVHDQKRVHCDVKPENILLGPNNELWLSDFGISIISRTSSMRSPSSITGTACYMAPEQFRGRPEPASDQYVLAVMVYEWLSGTPPFAQGDFIQLGYQHAHEPVPPLRDKASNISPDVEQVIMAALAKEPGLRFGSVRGFAYALEQAATRTEIVVPPGIPFSYPAQPVRIAPPPEPVRKSIESPVMAYQQNSPAPVRANAPAHPASLFKMKYIIGMVMFLLGMQLIDSLEVNLFNAYHIDSTLAQFNMFGLPIVIKTSTLVFLLILVLLLIILAKLGLIPLSFKNIVPTRATKNSRREK